MYNPNKRFLCPACDYEDVHEAFGKQIACPNCGGTDIVLADIWHRFKPAAGKHPPAHAAIAYLCQSAG